jgi:glucose-6-phosphate dehydrogenase assembly protein OpcA
MVESNRDWRELCAAAADEPDSEKLISLVDRILQAFDDRDKNMIAAGRSTSSNPLP